ncbi:SMI1/KNR4 family protein [Streptomyces sp. NPDC016845]|uniref:SMI1/KNR4 family protein n=1 Tax=Streptomyces sp. NPDC016845 TaxID=3364972 RepID=UPI0037A9ECDC
MNVEIPQLLRDTCAQYGEGVPYALRVTAERLAESPDLGHPSEIPGILTVIVDGDQFEDCPTLAVGYISEPDRVQIRYVSPVTAEESAESTPDGGDTADRGVGQERPDPAAEAVTVRQVADAWGRVTGWLKRHAPDSYAALRAGATPAEIAALEAEFGIPVPVELRVLWLLTGGEDGCDGRGCLLGNWALLPLDAVSREYRTRRNLVALGWERTWIPVAACGASDAASGLYLDAATGCLGRWSRYNEPPDEELDTLVTYLEEVADTLEAPALATKGRPGLIGGALVWRDRVEAGQEEQWRPLVSD